MDNNQNNSNQRTNIRIKPLVLTVSGRVPTLPTPLHLQLNENGWRYTDLADGEYAINSVDNLFFFRSNKRIFKIDLTSIENSLSDLQALSHNPVTVKDSSTVSFVLNGQELTATVIENGINHNNLSGKNGIGPEFNHLNDVQLEGLLNAINAIHNRKHSIISTEDHTSEATPEKLLKANEDGLPVSATNTDNEVSDAVSKTHEKIHSINSPDNHTSTATEGYILKADENGLPIMAIFSEVEVSNSIQLSHHQTHSINSLTDHTSSITPGNLIIADQNGLPKDSNITINSLEVVISVSHSHDNKDALDNVSGINTGDQVGDGITITGAGTIDDPFVATSTGTGDAIIAEIQKDSYNWGVDTGIADAMALTLNPAPTALTDGMIVRVRSAFANTITTPTLNVNSKGAKTIVKHGNQALAVGDIQQGMECELKYNLANTSWELMNPKASGGGGGITYIHRHDWQSPYDYIGKAVAGSLDTDAVWTITRLTISDSGSVTATSTLTNVKWSEHLILF